MAELSELGNLPATLGYMAQDYAAYWLSLPKRNGVPPKSALDPGAMRKFVANFVLVERHTPASFTWRLVGTRIRELSGIELTGTEAFTSRTEAQRAKALVAYNAQLDTPCGVWGVTIVRSAGGVEVPAEVMVFPLRAEDGSLRFLASTVEPLKDRHLFDASMRVEMQVMSWPEHRFIDIGFGVPKLSRHDG